MTAELVFSQVSRETDPDVIPAEGQSIEIDATNIAALTPLAEALTGNAPQVGDLLQIPDQQKHFPTALVYIRL